MENFSDLNFYTFLYMYIIYIEIFFSETDQEQKSLVEKDNSNFYLLLASLLLFLVLEIYFFIL